MHDPDAVQLQSESEMGDQGNITPENRPLEHRSGAGDGPGHAHDWVSRRRFLQVGGVVAAGAVAGCLGGDGGRAEAVALSGGLECDACGMVIENHPGPNGQVFFAENAPDGHDPPARFDSLEQCLFPYLFERRAMGWSETAVYVTDYAAVDYDVQAEGDTRVIESFTAPEAFADAEGLHYVVGSDVEGAMGPDFVPFSDRGDADEFAAEYGGDVLAYGDIDEIRPKNYN